MRLGQCCEECQVVAVLLHFATWVGWHGGVQREMDDALCRRRLGVGDCAARRRRLDEGEDRLQSRQDDLERVGPWFF